MSWKLAKIHEFADKVLLNSERDYVIELDHDDKPYYSGLLQDATSKELKMFSAGIKLGALEAIFLLEMEEEYLQNFDQIETKEVLEDLVSNIEMLQPLVEYLVEKLGAKKSDTPP